MTLDQFILLALVTGLLALFIQGRLRHDVIAAGGLVVAVLFGLVPADIAFTGLGHPAVVSVAAMMVLSRALSESGATDRLGEFVLRLATSPSRHVAALAAPAALMSTCMNNVGALGIALPVAMQTAARAGRSPSILLMPLSFAALLGGLITLIGTPPNIIVASYRATTTGTSFAMFDFAWVGLPVALIGVAFVSTIGWRLLPLKHRRATAAADFFAIADYVTEVRIDEKNSLIGCAIGEASRRFAALDVAILGLIRGGRRVPNVPRRFILRAEDILIIEVAPTALKRVIDSFGLELVGVDSPKLALLSSDEVRLAEVIVKPGSELDGRSHAREQLAQQFNVNLLALAREGSRIRDRLDRIVLRAGDVLLLQAETARLAEVTRLLGCLPLAERRIELAGGERARPIMAIFALTILAIAFGIVPLPVGLVAALVVLAVTGLLPTRELYEGIDWSVVVLLAAMIPIGDALQTTGLTTLVAAALAEVSLGAGPVAALVGMFVLTMCVTDILNNAATVVIMAPVAMGLAGELGVNPDTFLMGVAIAASCAFMTPIGHQNNTLIMGPGGYAFGDYWRMGLPLELIVLATAVPLLLFFWPLGG